MSNQPRMNPAIKQRWLEKLRSKQYTQGSGNLCVLNQRTNVEEWCCLGILADIAREDGIGDWLMAANSTGHKEWQDKSGSSYSGMTKAVARWAGFHGDHCDILGPRLEYQGYRYRAAHLNDGENEDGRIVRALSFEQIADLIEAQL